MVSRTKIVHWMTAPAAYRDVEQLWLRALGLIYLAAFGALWPQIDGLIGANGIAPASEFLAAIHGEIGPRAFYLVPTIYWAGISNAALLATCAIGCLGGVLLVLNLYPRLASIVCFVLYLSVTLVGSPFTNFQWDALLLETGFLAIFAGAPLLVWAYRLLLFRLMFESGLVKLLSGDPNWRNGHALRFHFLTQPLPTPLAYYAYRLPPGVLDGMTWGTLLIELAVPFLLFTPRIPRYVGVTLLALLQIFILLTGNYAFFNWLTLALCLWGLDDRVAVRWIRIGRENITRFAAAARAIACVILALLMLVGIGQVIEMSSGHRSSWLAHLTQPVAALEIVNSYGLFAVMTTTRPELTVEGSNDGTSWRPYVFPYKPGNIRGPLQWVAPYHPRLDWQMWFAALGTPGESPWFPAFVYRLLRGDRDVLGLLESAPFAKPPRYIRAVLYNYTFTTPTERQRTGDVWVRQQMGVWYGPASLSQAGQ